MKEPNVELTIQDYKIAPQKGAFQTVEIVTDRGVIECRYYAVEGTTCAALWVAGAGGGWGSPARGLYEQMCKDLLKDNIASLWLRYRHANQLQECILDVLAGLAFLETQGIDSVALIGHSFGGAVVAGAGAASPLVRTVIPMSTQSYGIDPIANLAENCSLLLIHSNADRVLPTSCSKYAYSIAHEPKKLILYDHAGHGLDEARSEIISVLHDWIVRELNKPK